MENVMKYRGLVCGWLAFAGGGVAAVAGGHADNWGHAIVYVATGMVLAGGAYWLLAMRPERQGMTTASLDPRFRDLSEAVGMTDENFIAWYQPIAEKQTESTIRFTTKVLKHRRGHILGVEDGQEAARRNRDRWTYAVFLAAIGQVSGSQGNRVKGLAALLLAVPESARDWLSREPKVLESLAEAVLVPEPRNAIWRLIDEATVKKVEQATVSAETKATDSERDNAPAEVSETPASPQPRQKRKGFETRLTQQPGSA